MGRASKPLVILAFGGVQGWEEVQRLRDQGHTVHDYPDGISGYDLILGPTAHRMSEHERKWLKNAIAEARRRKYPKAKPEELEDPEA